MNRQILHFFVGCTVAVLLASSAFAQKGDAVQQDADLRQALEALAVEITAKEPAVAKPENTPKPVIVNRVAVPAALFESAHSWLQNHFS